MFSQAHICYLHSVHMDGISWSFSKCFFFLFHIWRFIVYVTSLVCLAECYFLAECYCLAQCYLFSRMLWYFLFCDLLSPKLSPQAWQNIYSCLFWILFLFYWFQRTVYLLTRSHNKSIIIQTSPASLFVCLFCLFNYSDACRWLS